MLAQERLYRHYEARVYALAYRIVGQAADAQDVAQDSFIRCFQALEQYRGEAPFWAWLKQLTVRTALMRIRSKKRWSWFSLNTEYENGDEESPLTQVSCPQPNPESNAQTQAELAHYLNQLNPTARAVMYLYHAEGYSHAEIASMWGKSVSFSKSQLARAQRFLRQKMSAVEAQEVKASAVSDAVESNKDDTAVTLTIPKEVLS